MALLGKNRVACGILVYCFSRQIVASHNNLADLHTGDKSVIMPWKVISSLQARFEFDVKLNLQLTR